MNEVGVKGSRFSRKRATIFAVLAIFLVAGSAGLIASIRASLMVTPVSGDFFSLPGGCHPGRPIPLLYVHGTSDPLLPYYTGVNTADWPLPPIPQWLQQWASRDGCTAGPVIFLQQPKVTGEEWIDCKQDGIVVHYRIEGGGHAWPVMLGKQSGIALMWNFFQSHPLPLTEE